jgi:HK97 gp10 family phage protein
MSNSFNHWAAIANAIEPACTEIVSSVARNGAGEVRNQIQSNGQVLSGNMLKSVYASTPEGSDYKSDVDRGSPEVKPENSTEAIIGVSADYAIYPNYGTVHQAPKPFWEPAMDRVKVDFEVGLEDLAKKLEEAGK